MNDIDEKFALNENLSKKIQASLTFIIESLQKTKFQHTGKALVSFIPKSGYLINSILFSCKSNDPYSASILFRSLIEHSFRHLYVYTKALKENDDSVGKVYYLDLRREEDIRSLKKISSYKRDVYPDTTQWTVVSDTSGEKAYQEFEINRIFKYLIANTRSEEEIINSGLKNYLLERLTEYTNMSSSVHGGPFGELALYELLKDKSKLEATLNNFANESFALYKSIIETTYLFASLMDEKVNKYHKEITEVR